jgi:hypothetical protein
MTLAALVPFFARQPLVSFAKKPSTVLSQEEAEIGVEWNSQRG